VAVAERERELRSVFEGGGGDGGVAGGGDGIGVGGGKSGVGEGDGGGDMKVLRNLIKVLSNLKRLKPSCCVCRRWCWEPPESSALSNSA